MTWGDRDDRWVETPVPQALLGVTDLSNWCHWWVFGDDAAFRNELFCESPPPVAPILIAEKSSPNLIRAQVIAELTKSPS
jgi:hypothetical protein